MLLTPMMPPTTVVGALVEESRHDAGVLVLLAEGTVGALAIAFLANQSRR
jgi:hypothetical protein